MSPVTAKLKRNEMMQRDSIRPISQGEVDFTVITISHCYSWFFEIKCDTVLLVDTCAISINTKCSSGRVHISDYKRNTKASAGIG